MHGEMYHFFKFSVEDVCNAKCNAQKSAINPQEEQISFWRNNAQDYIAKKLKIETALNENKAKNIILFMGDGMSMQTVAATRMYIGGEELNLSFEEFPHFGLSKVSLSLPIYSIYKILSFIWAVLDLCG